MSLVAGSIRCKVLPHYLKGVVVVGTQRVKDCRPSFFRQVAAWPCRTFATGKAQDKDGEQSMFLEEMQDLNAEREALFGFTSDDHAGWSNSHNHKHDSSFLAQVNAAREATGTTVNELEDHDYDDDYHSNPMHDGDTVPFSFQKMRGKGHGDGGGGSHADGGAASQGLTHLTEDGGSIHMVDVGEKAVTKRIAVAETRVTFPTNVWNALTANSTSQELVGPKGPILTTAKVAGIMAAKKTSDLIPLCHPLPITSVNVDIVLEKSSRTAIIQCTCKVEHKTGVEMEALTGASVAALVIYDMCKALSHDIVIERTCLIKKSGGKRYVNKEEEKRV